MIHHESIEPARYLEDLERIQTEILSDASRAYRVFREIVAQDPEFWQQRADDYASRLSPDEADLRLQQDFVDQLVLERMSKRKKEIAELESLLIGDFEQFSGPLGQMAILDGLKDRSTAEPVEYS